MVHAVQRVTALDADGAGAGALDHGAHALQEVAEIDDLGLSRGVLDDRLAVGRRGGHEEVLGGADAGVVERDDRPLELRTADLDEAVVDLDGRAELLEAADVEVDAPRPDVAAAGHGDGGLAEARHQGAHDDDAGAHGAHELVGRAAAERGAGVHAQDVAGVLHVRAERAQHRHHGGDVGDARHAADDAGLVGEQTGGEELERRVLGAREHDSPLQTAAAAHQQARVVCDRTVHQTVTSIACAGAEARRSAGAPRHAQPVRGALERLLGAEVVDLGLRAGVVALLQALAGRAAAPPRRGSRRSRPASSPWSTTTRTLSNRTCA